MNAQQRNQAYLSRMNSIKDMFDGGAWIEELEAKQSGLLREASISLQNFSPAEILAAFDEGERYKWDEFMDNGLVKGRDSADSYLSALKAVLAVNTRNLSKLFSDFESWQTENKPSIEPLADDIDLEEDLTLLNTLYPYDVGIGGWLLPDFTLTPDNEDDTRTHVFSGLHICLDFNKRHFGDAIRIKVDDTKASRNSDGYFHPHVSASGGVCWGNSEDAVRAHWENKRLVPLFHILCAMFNTYNSGSPYAIIETWISRETFNCTNCGIVIYDDDTVFVGGDSDIPACKDCTGELGRGTRDFRWKHELVHSNMRSGYILKRDATEAWVNDDDQDWLPDILSSPHFSMCQGGCFKFVHNDYLSQVDGKSICIRCAEK